MDLPIKIPLRLKKMVDTTTQLMTVSSIPGLYYYPNFLTKSEGEFIWNCLESDTHWVGVTSNPTSRRVIQYGYKYGYTGGALEPTDKIPEIYSSMMDRFQEVIDLINSHTRNLPRIKMTLGETTLTFFNKTTCDEWKAQTPDHEKWEQKYFKGLGCSDEMKPQFDQLIINKYLPGQGIAPHIDKPSQFGPYIACVTLGSGVEIQFSKTGEETIPIYVEPNSLYIMSGDARYTWKHGIASRKSDLVSDQKIARGTRISLTFRTAL